MESEEEAICNEATATSSEVTNFCREIFEKTQKYLREPTPKSEGSKRCSKCSSMRAQIELKMQEEELERQDEAQKKLLEAELHLKLLQVDEEKRKKVQAAKDKVWLSELNKNSEDSSVDLENDANVQNLTEEWVNRVNKNQDGLSGNVDETTAQQNVIQVDTVVQPQTDSTMFFANTNTVAQPATSIHVRNEQSVVRVQPDTLNNSRSLPNQITSSVPPANIMTAGS